MKIQSANPDGLCSVADSTFLEEFDVNVTSVHRMTTALMPLLRKGKGKTIINMYGLSTIAVVRRSMTGESRVIADSIRL